MPPKADPYATPRTKLVDLFLCLLTIVMILIIIVTAPEHRAKDSGQEDRPQSGQLAAK